MYVWELIVYLSYVAIGYHTTAGILLYEKLARHV